MSARRMVCSRVAGGAFALLCATAGCSAPRDARPSRGSTAPTVVRLPLPAESTLTDNTWSRSVRRGRALLNATGDSLPRNVGNALRCTSCHLDDGTRPWSMPWVGVYARFPQYRSRSGGVDLIEDRVNDCFKRSLNGRALDPSSRDMRDIVAYFGWLSHGITVGRRLRGTGIDSVRPALEPDTARGATVFVHQCARCHGSGGQGIPAGKELPLPGRPPWGPPVAGPRSFNVGAGMDRPRVAAAFIRRNMPFDTPGTLSPQDAADVAAWVTSRVRPDFPGKEKDWPNGDPPPDVPYKVRGKAGR